jgi:sigma-B regulation protein RsbU (phosphoserine phosphatase)
MEEQIIPTGLELFQLICVIVLGLYFVSRTRLFSRVIFQQGTIYDKIFLTFFFGLLSVYGTMSGISIFEAQANVRDLGPVIAGLTCGPFIGLGASIIGVIYRYSLGGSTVVPCCLSTIIAGLLAGIIWYYNKKQFIGLKYAILFVIFLEMLHTDLVYLIAGYAPDINEILVTLGISDLILNVIGIFCFSIIFQNYVIEKRNQEILERERIEFEIARNIQNDLLPTVSPTINGYEVKALSRPAREIGGDFYDFIYSKETNFGFIIADVSGKSIPAAIYMGLSCKTVHASIELVQDPGKAIEDANNMICEYSKMGMFLSVFYGVLNPASGVLIYVNAGHPPPIVIRHNGEVEYLQKTGMVLGVEKEKKYLVEKMVLKKKDLLFCYTDGITESMNIDGKMIGVDNIIQVLQKNKSFSVDDIINEVMIRVDSFAGNELQFDDITLVVLKKD